MTDVSRPASVSVAAIIPNYNGESFLPDVMKSLLTQKVAFDEILFIDDGSTDNSVNIINEYAAKHPAIKLIQHDKNKGVCAALNTGIAHAASDYILLGAVDDLYHEKMISSAQSILAQYPNLGLVCGDAIVKRYDMTEPFYRTLPYPKKYFISAEEFKNLTLKQYVGFNAGGGMLMSRKAVVEAGMLDEKTRWHCDWILYFAVAMRYGFYYVDEVFITINMREAGYSEGKYVLQDQKEVIRNTIKAYRQDFPDLYYDFRKAGLLPSYSVHYLPLIVLDKELRDFFTLKLAWKCVINNKFVVKIGRMFPYRIIMSARKLLRA